MSPRFDTEKPPLIGWRDGHTLGVGRDKGEFPVGAQITLDFTRNPEAARPFWDWLNADGDIEGAWAAFGDWYDLHARKYENGTTS